MNVTINQNNTVHRASVGDYWTTTICNNQPFDLNERRRQPYKSDYAVTCKKCLKLLAEAEATNGAE